MGKIDIVAFAFGEPPLISSNRRIARIASRKARELNALVYTQFDVIIDPGIEVRHIKEKLGEPPPTLRIARGAIQWAKQCGFKELWIVAAEPHLWRVIRDMKRAVCEAGKKEIEINICNEIYYYSEISWFDIYSTQLRTRSRYAWNKREIILKLMPFFIYKRVAS